MKAVVFYSEHESAIMRDFQQRAYYTLASYGCKVENTFKVEAYLPEASLIDAEVVFVLLSNNLCEQTNWWRTIALSYVAEHLQNNITLIPVVVKPCNWKNELLQKVQQVPFRGEPLTIADDFETSWECILDDIGGLLNNLSTSHLVTAA